MYKTYRDWHIVAPLPLATIGGLYGTTSTLSGLFDYLSIEIMIMLCSILQHGLTRKWPQSTSST